MAAKLFRTGYGLRILFPITLAVLAVLAHGYNLLLFHTSAELFAIFVALMTSVVAWHTYHFSRNDYLMYLGVGYAFIGFIDFLHTLTFEGMPMLAFGGSNTSSQFWIVARFLEAFVLLSAPLFLSRRFNRQAVLIVFAAVTGLLSWLVATGRFPETYRDGVGLTDFKISAEYGIIALLAVGAVYLWHRRALLSPSIIRLMLASIALTAVAEASFTGYINLNDVPLMAGHIFKFFSFWLIFLAVIQTTLSQPFETMARGSSTYDAIPDAITVVDKQGLIRQVNRAACNVAGKTAEELVGSHFHGVFHPPETTPVDCPVCQALARGERLSSREMKFTGTGRWGSYSLSPIEANSQHAGMVHVFRDVTERKRADEALRHAHDELEVRVRERTGDLLAANQQLQAEIQVREQVQDALLLAKEEAEAANRAKSDFLSRMSHELRTPLNAVLGFAQLLKADEEIARSEVYRDNVEQILRAGWHLLDLIDEVLDLAKIESGRFTVAITGVKLERVLAECLELSQVMADPRRITLHCDLGSVTEVCVSADHIRLKQVLINLISNAIKYNVDGGRVTIAADRTRHNTVQISVSDTGRGIPTARLAELFQPFNRLGAEKTGIEGTGIGLVISKRLVELMGGRITVESEIDRGSSFCVELPGAECDDFN